MHFCAPFKPTFSSLQPSIRPWIKTWIGNSYSLTLQKPQTPHFCSETKKKRRRKRRPVVIDNTLGVVTSSRTFRNCSFVKIFKSKRMIKNMQERVLYLRVCIIVPVLERVNIWSRISIRSASHSDVS